MIQMCLALTVTQSVLVFISNVFGRIVFRQSLSGIVSIVGFRYKSIYFLITHVWTVHSYVMFRHFDMDMSYTRVLHITVAHL
jgi:hypothetical protein